MEILKVSLLAMIIFGVLTKSFANTEKITKHSSALVLSGKGLRVPVWMGVIQELIDQNKKPGIIIGTCGGSIAAAIASHFKSLPGENKYLEVIKSDEVYEFLKNIQTTEYSSFSSLLPEVYKMNTLYQGPGYIADVFNTYLLDLDQKLNNDLPFLNTSDWQDPEGIPSLMVTAELKYGPEHAGDQKFINKEMDVGYLKMFTETIVTDPNTAKMINTAISPIGLSFPKGRVDINMNVYSNWAMADAVRASISDPFFVEPFFSPVTQRHYLTGGIDLYPIEVAKQVANKVIALYTLHESSVVSNFVLTTPAFYSIFHYDLNERLKTVNNSPLVDVWMNGIDFDEKTKPYPLNPGPSISEMAMISEIPNDKAEYDRRVDELYHYGRNLIKEAIVKYHY